MKRQMFECADCGSTWTLMSAEFEELVNDNDCPKCGSSAKFKIYKDSKDPYECQKELFSIDEAD